MTIEERRVSRRATVQLSVIEEHLASEQTVTAVDINEHGMQYRRPFDKKRNPGEEVLLTFSLLDRLQPIKVLGWIVNERLIEHQIATHITFMFLREQDEAAIQSFIETQGS